MTPQELADEFIVNFQCEEGFSCMPSAEQSYLAGFKAAETVKEDLLEQVETLRENLKIAEEALRFYADKDNWQYMDLVECESGDYENIDKNYPSRITGGKLARGALSKIRGENG